MFLKLYCLHTTYRKNNNLEKCAGMGLNGFHTIQSSHLPQNWAYFEVNGLDWQCCLAGSSQRAPRILIFSIVLGAKCLSYLKSIETHARAFSRLISDGISGVVMIQNWRGRRKKVH